MSTGIGLGSTLTLASSSHVYTIRNIDFSGFTREAHNVSHMGTTGGMDFVPAGLYDAGEFELDCLYDPAVQPQINSAAEQATIAPIGGSDTLVGTAFVVSSGISLPFDDLMTCRIRFKMSGDWVLN